MASRAVWLLAGAVWLVDVGLAPAEVVRFRYRLMDTCGNSALIPGPAGAPGERAAWLGGAPSPFQRQILPTHIVTFRHPYTGQNLNVPLTFPDGIPRVEHRADYVIYNYTAYQIRALFLPDGGVEVIYNSGALRPLSFQ